nr:erythrocyte membrane protein 1, PfEMP1, putative [Plasmodium sp. DRC-Itaito]
MCEKWENNHERLDKLKEEWEKGYTSGNINPTDNIPSDMDKPNQVENTNPHHQDHNHNPTLPYDPNLVENNINPLDTPTMVQIELSVKNGEMVKENFPIGDVWDI